MRTILVANAKGGCGKTTIATGLAARFAIDGKRTVLVDADPQRSSTRWCEKRAGLEAAVLPIDGTGRKAWSRAIPSDAQRVVIDAPAGAMGPDLAAFLDAADAVLVPVLPSAIDLEASVPFLDSLAAHPRVRKGALPVGLVGNRLRPWTAASQQAVEQLEAWPYPVVARLRDTQAYVLLAGLGKSVWDFQSEQVRGHQADWAPLLKWLKKSG
jgi:chromosome partitioning protein